MSSCLAAAHGSRHRWRSRRRPAGRRQGWGGLRNLIAHQYGSLNLEPVADALYDELEELRELATEDA